MITKKGISKSNKTKSRLTKSEREERLKRYREGKKRWQENIHQERCEKLANRTLLYKIKEYFKDRPKLNIEGNEIINISGWKERDIRNLYYTYLFNNEFKWIEEERKKGD